MAEHLDFLGNVNDNTMEGILRQLGSPRFGRPPREHESISIQSNAPLLLQDEVVRYIFKAQAGMAGEACYDERKKDPPLWHVFIAMTRVMWTIETKSGAL